MTEHARNSTATLVRPGWLGSYLRPRYDPVLLILSPPRCGSTAVARAFWQHPAFRRYVHEPCDSVYHRDGGPAEVVRAVEDGVDTAVGGGPPPWGNGIIVKEMTFQAGGLLPEFLAAATLPVLFTIRDPRLSIRSRMRQRERGGQPAWFPPAESGWHDLDRALALARDRHIPYAIAEFDRLCADPPAVIPAACRRLGLPDTPAMLSWAPARDVSLGQLGRQQRHWYERVLASDGFQPPAGTPPPVGSFPAGHGIRAHVADCLDRYERALHDPGTI
jgi:Sulfotransferase domain